MDRTRESIEKELRDCIVDKVKELNEFTGMSVKEVDVIFMRADFANGRSEYFLTAIDINYHSHY